MVIEHSKWISKWANKQTSQQPASQPASKQSNEQTDLTQYLFVCSENDSTEKLLLARFHSKYKLNMDSRSRIEFADAAARIDGFGST